MLYLALFFLASGLPCIAFSFYLKKAPAAEVRSSKKSRRKKKISKSEAVNGKSFLYGGVAMTGLGLLALARYYGFIN
jgi:hypothetical protein